MRADRFPGLRAAAVLAAIATLGVLTIGPAEQARATNYEQARATSDAQARATNYAPIVGAGSTYAYPALNQWATDLVNQGVHISYSPNGSAQGRQNYIQGTVDYAGSDIAFLGLGDPDPFGTTDGSQLHFAYSYIPDVAGGLSFLYNIQVAGRRITNMRLSGETLAKIFTGQINNWDNSAITKDYGKQLPSIPITVVTRSDGAGESYFLTNWLLDEYPKIWVPYCRQQGGGSLCSKKPTESYPAQHAGFKPLQGSASVAGYINQPSANGAIGYAEYAYAIPSQIPVVSVLNKAGYYQQPTAANVAVSLHAAKINEDQNSLDFLMQDLTNVYSDTDPRTYPLSSYSYLIVPRNSRKLGGTTYHPLGGFTAGKGQTLSKYVGYILCQAQQSAANLGYSPLPKPMVLGGFTQYNHIPGHLAPPQGKNYNNCNNPAYKNGVDTILASAPYPSKCQKVGAPLTCGNGSSNGSTSSGNGNGNGNSPGPSSSASSSASVNPNTGQVASGSGPGSANPNVNAQPVSLVGRPAEQSLLATLTTLELIAVVVVPVVLGSWLQRRRRGAGATAGRGRAL